MELAEHTWKTPSRMQVTRSEIVAFVVMLLIFGVGPFFIYPVLLMQVMCFAMFACAFNLLIGYVGLLSFGHALFFGWASYLCALAAKNWGMPPEAAILIGTGMAALLGVVVGLLAIRRHGIYFAMVTLALAQMMYFVAVRSNFTGGENGIQSIPQGRMFGFVDLSDPAILYSVVFFIFIATFIFIYRIVHSPFGEVLKAIRENEDRAISLGYKTERYKFMAFVLCAALSGLAGATKSIVVQIASLTDVSWHMSGEVILMCLVGGLGTMFGPIVGALVILPLQNSLSWLGEWVPAIQGAIFVVCVLIFRRGFVGELTKRLGIKL
jgi:branched-chain amino acid transport system permease protein